MNLGARKITFNADGDAAYLHEVIMNAFPQVESCGGYSFMRVMENSRYLVEIDGPNDGITVPFLRGVLNQAKLYIRPLQSDIVEQLVDSELDEVNVGNEPIESCRKCGR
jgi:hypothetical protein